MDDRPTAQQQLAHSNDHIQRRLGHASAMVSRSTSFDRRTRTDVDSWVEISSQPSSSSLSSIGDEIVTTGLRVQEDQRTRRRRTQRPGAPTHLNITRMPSADDTSSQEEHEESESESDRVMNSSNEGPIMAPYIQRPTLHTRNSALKSSASGGSEAQPSDDDDENRTAIGYPINSENCFTPLPNAFTHPPNQRRNSTQQVAGSYFPQTRPAPVTRPSTRHSYPTTIEGRRHSHVPQNPLSPSFNTTTEHDEALRASLNSLLSVAAAARGLPKSKQPIQPAHLRSNRIDPMTFRLVPESALQPAAPSPPQLQEPTFRPTLRRTSTTATSTSATSAEQKDLPATKRKATGTRSSSRERRALKKARRSSSTEDLHVTPTLLTWVVSAGIVVCLSALSFGAGYSMGKEAGRLDGLEVVGDEQLRSCAREASRSGLGLKRSLARSAIQV